MKQILALQVNARAAEMSCQAISELERRGTAREILQKIVEAGLERSVGFGLFIDSFQFEQRHHERFGNVAAAIRAKAPGYRGGDSELRGHGVERILSHKADKSCLLCKHQHFRQFGV